MVPHLATALKGPLLDLEHRILNAQHIIEHWFRAQWQEHTPPFYTSVDLRNAGFKLAPVDTNLFPGGFNNLNPVFLPLCVQAVQSAVEKICPEARGILLVPEAGMRVRIGTLLPEITQPTKLQLPNGATLTLEPLQRRGRRLTLEDFDPCVVLLNNDLSAGVPDILQDLEQTVLPPLLAGWTTRRKSHHFSAYDRVANEFAELINIDPWLINPYFASCGKVDFQQRSGEDCLAAQVDAILQKTRTKYAEYDVKEAPFVIVKADAGTYGMGIMSVKDASEVQHLNRKQRNKMAVVKDGLEVSEVLVQEGVYTFENINDAVAEPVVYMIDRYVVGGFYRVHTGRGVDENLNAPGMHFEPLAFETCCTLPNQDCHPDDMPNRFYAYGVVARLAMLAAALELEEIQQ